MDNPTRYLWFTLMTLLVILCAIRILQVSTPTSTGTLAPMAPVAGMAPGTAPISLTITDAPILFKVDGRPVLFYEIYASDYPGLQPSKLEVLDERNQVIHSISGSALNDTLMAPHAGIEQTTVRIWVELGNRSIPTNLSHRLYFANSSIMVSGAQTPVIVKTLPVIAPPLRPANWWSANAPANLNGHRSAIFEVIGNRYLPERYAIDWVIGDENGSTHRANGSLNSDYYAYGQDLLAVSNGTIVGVFEGVPDSTPPNFPPTHFLTLGGNYVVLDMHNGYYAFYAHLIPGSLTVKNGDNVTVGQVLGKLGSSGNSNAPHLHFHVCDSMDYIFCHGQPYVLANYSAGKMFNASTDQYIQNPVFVSYTDSMPEDADTVRWE